MIAIPAQYKLAALAGLAIAAFAGGWLVNGWRLGGALAEANQQHAETLKAVSDQSLAALKAAQAEVDAKQQAITKIDLQRIKEAQQNAIEKAELRAAVAAGTRRLSVRAHCPAASTMPAAAGGAGLDAAGTPELDPAARQDYYDLRAGLAEVEAELTACKRVALAATERKP